MSGEDLRGMSFEELLKEFQWQARLHGINDMLTPQQREDSNNFDHGKLSRLEGEIKRRFEDLQENQTEKEEE